MVGRWTGLVISSPPGQLIVFSLHCAVFMHAALHIGFLFTYHIADVDQLYTRSLSTLYQPWSLVTY